ncbi:MAG: YhbY family RNA-binding protein [Desulfobacterales bacterium]|nr:YhbY family RNA-binding protein [Desulfobacterales bacterium]
MKELKGSQRKYLRGLAHKLNPSAFIGQKGVTPALLEEIEQALDAGELIKVKFVDFKEKDQKTELLENIVSSTRSHLAGMIGHVAILYRQNADVEKRSIKLP